VDEQSGESEEEEENESVGINDLMTQSAPSTSKEAAMTSHGVR